MTFQPPTIEEAKEYANSIGYKTFNPVKWWHWYNSKNWKVGRGTGTKMTSWKSAVWTWFTNTFEWRELQRKENENKKDVQRQRDYYADYIRNASAIKLGEMLKAPELEHIYWLIKELRPEIRNNVKQ